MHAAEKAEIQHMLTAIDQELAKRANLRFRPALETEFEAQTGQARAGFVAKLAVLSLVLFEGMLLLDRVAVPDAFALALWLRLGLFGAVNAIAIPLLWRNPDAPLREGLLAGISVLAAGIVCALTLMSDMPMRVYYPFGILFLILFAVSAQRIRFVYAVPAVMAMLALHAVATSGVSTMEMASRVAAIGLTQMTVVFVMITAYALERQERRIWLHAYGDRLRAQLFEELSMMDPLTGLGNRRAMEQWTHLRIGREAIEISVIMADIDFFKSYNDALGHLAGDDCIRRVAGVLMAETRGPDDGIFRFGGEEFVVVLVGTSNDVARLVAERMRRGVGAARIPHKTAPGPGHVTVSFGVATAVAGEDFVLDCLIDQADAALYEAKQSGRNRVAPPFLEAANLQQAG